MVQITGEKLRTGYFNHIDSFLIILVFLCFSIYIFLFYGLHYGCLSIFIPELEEYVVQSLHLC